MSLSPATGIEYTVPAYCVKPADWDGHRPRPFPGGAGVVYTDKKRPRSPWH